MFACLRHVPLGRDTEQQVSDAILASDIPFLALPSLESIAFLRLLLARSPDDRPAAYAALQQCLSGASWNLAVPVA